MKRLRLWKPRSISTKLFALTSLLLIAFLTLLLLVQTNFFESYYQHKKLNQLKADLSLFKAQHYQSPADISKLPTYIPELESRLLGTAAILQLRDGSLTLGPQVRTKAIIQMDKNGNVTQTSNQMPAFEPSTLMSLVNAVQLFRGNNGLTRQVLDLGITAAFHSPAGNASNSYIAAVIPLGSSGSPTEYALIAVTSLQPVGEATGIMKDFYWIFLLLAIIMILLLTYLYSRMISRPLIKLNAVASQMAKLDFSIQCDVKTQDELGNLGSTLNFLSGNLNSTLDQLHTANKQLHADIEKEKELEKLRREFVASVSHELKTPISLISGYAEGIRDGIVSGARREEYLDVILEESGRMAGLVQDMLDLSQLESGKFKLTEGSFPLHELLAGTADKMSMEAHRRDVAVHLELGGPDIAYGDVQRIGQVVTNLLSNALKHTPEGGSVSIRTLPAREGVLVEVSNDGEPIPDEELPRIWETFYTVEKSHNREQAAGSGIGLAIVYNILSLHGSRFGVRNRRQPDGVVFSFTLRAGD